MAEIYEFKDKNGNTFKDDYDEYGRPIPSERQLSEQEEKKRAKKASA